MSAALQPPVILGRLAPAAIWTHAQLTNLRVIWLDAAWSRREIATEVKHSVDACDRMAGRLGLGPRPTLRGRFRARWRTDDRKAILVRDWPTGRATRAIMDEMNTLSGEPVPALTNILEWASGMGLRRPETGPGHPKRARVRGETKARANVVLLQRSCLRCCKPFGADTKFLRMCLPCRQSA